MDPHAHKWTYRSPPKAPVAIDVHSAAAQLVWGLTNDTFQFGILTCDICKVIVAPSRELTPDEVSQIERDGLPKPRRKKE